mmetsp:Transcript_34044/g.105340  ORF Transcript_34044/g.105340 Transcript_34044/m.105340 type:complete len:233 (-) Transcript_34044:670-1368(-)
MPWLNIAQSIVIRAFFNEPPADALIKTSFKGPVTTRSTSMAPCRPRLTRHDDPSSSEPTKWKETPSSHAAATTKSSSMPCSSPCVESRHSIPINNRPSGASARFKTVSCDADPSAAHRIIPSTCAAASESACDRTTSTRSARSAFFLKSRAALSGRFDVRCSSSNSSPRSSDTALAHASAVATSKPPDAFNDRQRPAASSCPPGNLWWRPPSLKAPTFLEWPALAPNVTVEW